LKSNKDRLDLIECENIDNVSENRPRSENRTARYNVQPNHDGINLQNIKVEAPIFDGHWIPKIFSIGPLKFS